MTNVPGGLIKLTTVPVPGLSGNLIRGPLCLQLANESLRVDRSLPTQQMVSAKLWWIPNTWWRHQMETFSALLAICAGNSPVPGKFPAQRPVTRSFDFSLICVWINGWVNNLEAGDLRRYRAHYDVTVMRLKIFIDFRSALLWLSPKLFDIIQSVAQWTRIYYCEFILM